MAPTTIPSTVKLTTMKSTSLQTTDLNRIIDTISTTALSTLTSQQDVTSDILENTTPSTYFTTGIGNQDKASITYPTTIRIRRMK